MIATLEKPISADLVTSWRAAIEAVDPGADAALTRLRSLSLRFIDADWLDVALVWGWSECELWGVFPVAIEFARRRLDCLGLVPGIALGGLTGRLVEIGPDAAIIERTSNGSRLRHARQLGGREWSRPWWQCWRSRAGLEAERADV
jgi:hypothetical protein